MKYIFNQCRHEPPESYGDCVRACVASLLSLEADQVPHFFHDGCDGATGHKRMREWLAGRDLVPVCFVASGDLTIEELLQSWNEMNPDATAMLLAGTATGDHAVIIKQDKIEHNPAWYGGRMIGPGSTGFYQIVVLAVR